MSTEALHRSTITLLLLVVLAIPTYVVLSGSQVEVAAQTGETSGALTVLDSSGKPGSNCPLKHTDVKAEISGFLSRVRVTQEFENPFKEKIEAVYTFPLPQNAAIDDMTMIIGTRTVRGKILPSEEAQAVYDSAKANGQVASLLDQERPNIFTQSVANILPGEKIKVIISYVETLKYENGAYEFVFPMVVGPRYIPGTPAVSRKGNGFAPDTDQVPDASRITPKLAPQGMRSGHDVSLEVKLDAGLIVDGLSSKSHAVEIEQVDSRSANIRLKENTTIPNKDFVLRYDVASASMQDAVLTHRSEKGGFFTMILQPPDRVTVADVAPKELVFVLDTSGSMQGFPIEKAKETMNLALANLNPSDTFNLITFAGDTHVLFPEPVQATKTNLLKAQEFLSRRTGSGGTEMMKAIQTSLQPSDKQDHLRIVCFMTDGYVGNDMEIIAEIQKHKNARVFAFGIGEAVNRFLLDKMAEAGRGEVEYVSLSDDGSAAAKRFHERVRHPLLTDISIEWNGLPVSDVYPQRVPDLFSAKPVVLAGRYTTAASGSLRLKGKVAGQEFVREIPVSFPETMAAHDVLSTLWARRRIDDLMSQDFSGMQRGEMRPDLKQTIIQVGLEYRLMTQFTSFVAVEEIVVTDGGQPRRIDVPVEVPAGVNRETADPQQPMNKLASSGSYARTARQSAALHSRPMIAPGNGGGSGVAPSSTPVPVLGVATRQVLAAEDPAALKLNPVDLRKRQLSAKLHPSVYAIVQRIKASDTRQAPDEARFVNDGKAQLQVWLVDKSPEALTKLKALGFEVVLDQKSSKLLIGRISIDKLEALADLNFVRYVSPLIK